MNISSIKEKDSNLCGYAVLGSLKSDTARNGKPYLRGTFTDATGTIGFTLFDSDLGFSAADNGKAVSYMGFSASLFNGSLQLNGSFQSNGSGASLRVLENITDDIRSQLVPGGDADISDKVAYIENQIASIKDPDLQGITSTIWSRVRDEFIQIPAAMRHHHSELHGLLNHTTEMLCLAKNIPQIYRAVDYDLLRAGIILHDVGKLREFVCSPLGLVSDYSPEGNLIGHLIIGAEMVDDVARELGVPQEKSLLLQNMILSHHGKAEFGAAAKPAILEAVILFYLDYASSHIREYSDLLARAPEGGTTEYISDINGRLFKH